MTDETKPKQPWTPGRWMLSGPVGKAGWIESETPGTNGTIIAAVHRVATPEGCANSVLIAAAPDLARALAEMVTAFEGTQQAPDDGSSVRWVRLIRSAEKARDVLDAADWQWCKP